MNNKDKIILDLCGGTGNWSKPYKEAGYDVKVITLPDYDIFKTRYINAKSEGLEFNGTKSLFINYNAIYGILAAPPCTMFSFARTNAKKPRDLMEGMEIVIACLRIIWKCQYDYNKGMGYKTSLKFWCMENPNGFLKHFLGKPVVYYVFSRLSLGRPGDANRITTLHRRMP